MARHLAGITAVRRDADGALKIATVGMGCLQNPRSGQFFLKHLVIVATATVQQNNCKEKAECSHMPG